MKGNSEIFWSTVLYNPENYFFEYWNNLNKYSNDLSLLVHDNSINNNFDRIEQNNLIYKVHLPENVGLGRALHDIGKYAFDSGAKWLVYFDQDSSFTDESIKCIISLLKSPILSKYPTLGSISLRDSSYSQDISEIKLKKVILPQGSAIVFNVAALKNIGFHDANIYLDCMDYFLDYTMRKNGYSQYIFHGIKGANHIKHQPSRFLNLFGFKIRVFLYRKYPFWRVKNTIKITLKLILINTIRLDFIFLFYIARFFLIYCFFQIFVRIFDDKN